MAAAALVLASLCALVWWDGLVGNGVPVLQALVVPWVIGAGIIAVAALIVRTRVALLACVPLVVAAIAAVFCLTCVPGAPDETRRAAGQRHLTVFSLNAEYGGADVSDVMAALRRVKPDVVIFVEMTAPKLASLDAAGLVEMVPHRTTGMIDDGSRGSIVLSRFPLDTLDEAKHLGPYDLQRPVARVHAPGADVVVKAVHTYPPLRDGVAQWRPQLEREGRWQRGQHADHVIMAGDFNASRAHPSFRAMADGLVDAYPSVESAWMPTWPQGGSVPPFAQIDHVLTRGFVPQDAGVTRIADTDHAAVWAALRY